MSKITSKSVVTGLLAAAIMAACLFCVLLVAFVGYIGWSELAWCYHNETPSITANFRLVFGVVFSLFALGAAKTGFNLARWCFDTIRNP